MPEILRYTAFTDNPNGGNPAGVVLDASGLADDEMRAIAADLGYSETAFATQREDGDYDVRYFSPEAEVPFCGHATIATAVAMGDGTRTLYTQSGPVKVTTEDGAAALTSVEPHIEDAPDALVHEALAALRWEPAELDPRLPVKIGYAGARHLILAAATRQRLRELDYDFDRLKQAMLAHDLTTVDLVHRENDTTFHARNPFPVGGVVEDPATGAAAAAFGAYLRALGAIAPPVRLTVHQGDDLGRPSLLLVDVDPDPASGI